MSNSYSVEGIVYSGFTKAPAKTLNIEQAAELAEVTPRTVRKWLKKPFAPRQLTGQPGDPLVLDYEFQEFVNRVIRAPKPKRTWQRALDALKSLNLIDRQSLIKKLQKRHDEPWTEVQRKFNRYDHSHVEAYRRGVEDAMRIVQRQGVECWDYVPQLGQPVWVGGCVGFISWIDDTIVRVSGTYVYSSGDDDDRGYAESWRFTYQRNDIDEADVRPHHYGKWPINECARSLIWNFESIKHNNYG